VGEARWAGAPCGAKRSLATYRANLRAGFRHGVVTQVSAHWPAQGLHAPSEQRAQPKQARFRGQMHGLTMHFGDLARQCGGSWRTHKGTPCLPQCIAQTGDMHAG
jgi:hypothetical protein